MSVPSILPPMATHLNHLNHLNHSTRRPTSQPPAVMPLPSSSTVPLARFTEAPPPPPPPTPIVVPSFTKLPPPPHIVPLHQHPFGGRGHVAIPGGGLSSHPPLPSFGHRPPLPPPPLQHHQHHHGLPPPPQHLPPPTRIDPSLPLVNEVYGADLSVLGKRGHQQTLTTMPGGGVGGGIGGPHSLDEFDLQQQQQHRPKKYHGGSNRQKKISGGLSAGMIRQQVAGRRRARKMFTDTEVANLVKGVEEFGEGKWSKILEEYDFDDRTSVDLKDKWRNLQKPSSTVKVPKDRRPRLPYTEEECGELRRGVTMYGHNWVKILKKFKFNPERTPVDLKDKWRNMQMKSGAIPPPVRKPRRFLLLDAEDQIFRNVYPRDAALKAATRGYEYIRLLQIGTPRIHVFAGERERVEAPSIRKFRGAQNGQIWKGRVLKLGMERATVHQLSRAKASVSEHLGKEAAHDIAPNIPTPDTSHLGSSGGPEADEGDDMDGVGVHDDHYSGDNDGQEGYYDGGSFDSYQYEDQETYEQGFGDQQYDDHQSPPSETLIMGQAVQPNALPQFSNQNYHNGQPPYSQLPSLQHSSPSTDPGKANIPPPPPAVAGHSINTTHFNNTSQLASGSSMSVSPPANLVANIANFNGPSTGVNVVPPPPLNSLPQIRQTALTVHPSQSSTIKINTKREGFNQPINVSAVNPQGRVI